MLFFSIISVSSMKAQCIVADYPFSGNANDMTPNNLHGIVSGASLVPDRYGNPSSAYEFDGVNDYIMVPYSTVLDFDVNDDYTISLWVKPNAVQNSASEVVNEILSKRNDIGGGQNEGFPFSLRYYNETSTAYSPGTIFAPRFDKDCNNRADMRSNTAVNDQFHHIVIMKEGAELRMYIDNILDVTTTDNAVCSTINDDEMYFGRRGGAQNATYFTGVIDDIKIFDCALDSAQVDALFNGNPIGFDEMGSDVLESTAYPNPANEKLVIHLQGEVKGDIRISIFDTQGRNIMVHYGNTSKTIIPISGLSSGLFFYTISQDNEVISMGKFRVK